LKNFGKRPPLVHIPTQPVVLTAGAFSHFFIVGKSLAAHHPRLRVHAGALWPSELPNGKDFWTGLLPVIPRGHDEAQAF